MRYYAAPMEGLTGYIYRNAHHACFPGADMYFTPFVSPNQNHEFSAREINDLLPENNTGVPVVPQVLCANADDFLWAEGAIADMGYSRVDLNLGCPSPTVVTKGKGSRMLADPEGLDAFLDAVFSKARTNISVKTRIGISNEGEFDRILEVYNRYPICELTVHARVQTDMYRRPARPASLSKALTACRFPVIYNGDLFSPEDAAGLTGTHSSLSGMMFGRGLIANPALILACKGLEMPGADAVRTFHDMLFEGYRQTMPGDRAMLFKMKELWLYMGSLFPERGNFDKKLKKVSRADEYAALAADLFKRCEPDFGTRFCP